MTEEADATHNVNENTSLLISHKDDDHCGHHDGKIDSSKEMRQMLYSCALTTVFLFVELIGGYFAGSLAIMSDAAHMLSDLAGMIISLVAIWLAQYPPTEKMSFGYARAEVIGALFSLILIWVITAFLSASAVLRFLHPKTVNGPLMVLLGAIGLIINLLIGLVLGHGHFHLHGDDNCGNHDHGEENNKEKKSGFLDWDRMTGSFIKNPNIRAAFIHVLGDALQNIGVIIAGVIITIRPKWTFIDPAVTLLFAIIVFMTTKNLSMRILGILMEGVPKNVSLNSVRERLRSIKGVSSVAKLHAWSIGMENHQIAVHLTKDVSVNEQDILIPAKNILENEFKVTSTIVEITN